MYYFNTSIHNSERFEKQHGTGMLTAVTLSMTLFCTHSWW